jgi:hypothetical protein
MVMVQAHGKTWASPAPAADQTSLFAMGWTVFASFMMVMQGFWWMFTGLVALLDDEFYGLGNQYLFQFDARTWGWVHLFLGVVVLAAGSALFSGKVWARTVGVLVAAVAMLVAFVWLPLYPVWALLFIAVSTSVIWALTVHGRDMTAM